MQLAAAVTSSVPASSSSTPSPVPTAPVAPSIEVLVPSGTPAYALSKLRTAYNKVAFSPAHQTALTTAVTQLAATFPGIAVVLHGAKVLLPVESYERVVQWLQQRGVPPVQVARTALPQGRNVLHVLQDEAQWQQVLDAARHSVSSKQATASQHMLRQAHASVDGQFLSLDIEQFEHDASKLLEVGVTIGERLLAGAVQDAKDPPGWRLRSYHYIVSENVRHVNRRWVKGCPNNFLFGDSLRMREHDVVARVREHFAVSRYFIGHGAAQDLKWLRAIDVQPTVVFDTQELNAMMPPAVHAKRCRLSALLEKQGIEAQFLHNAGNDAYYTMLCFCNQLQATLPVANGTEPAGDSVDASLDGMSVTAGTERM